MAQMAASVSGSSALFLLLISLNTRAIVMEMNGTDEVWFC